MNLVEQIRSLFTDEEKRPYSAGVILAAGNSVRMGENKIEMASGGMPVYIRTLKVFENAESIDETVLVTQADRIEALAEEIKKYDLKKVKCVISGGATRVESSLAGVMAVSKQTEIIAIHDCARPFVTEKIINDTVEAAAKYNAAAPAVPCVDTLKVRDGEFMNGTVDRESLCRIQTPQTFKADLIKGALTYVLKKGLPVTDDTSAAEYMGCRTKIVEGDPDNIKLTTREDLRTARAILVRRGELPPEALMEEDEDPKNTSTDISKDISKDPAEVLIEDKTDKQAEISSEIPKEPVEETAEEVSKETASEEPKEAAGKTTGETT